jgi:D-alanyl-D-alanine carboxypeptidase
MSLTICSIFLLLSCNKEQVDPAISIQQELNEAAEKHYGGLILCVKNDDKTDLYSAGYSNNIDNKPTETDDLFKIASISKLYIAVACAKLVDDGTLDLNKTLNDYTPDIADRIEYSNQITLKMLIQHRSGIPNYIDDENYPWGDPFETQEELFDFALDRPANFEPDKRRQYSNTNYLIIGKILDEQLGYHHQEYIENEILNPLGLHNTFGSHEEINLDQLMSGYHDDQEYDFKNDHYIAPGGSMIATAEDVAVFVKALNEQTLLTSSEHGTYASLYDFDHTGYLPGYLSIARYDNDLNASIVLFSNTSQKNGWSKFERLYKRIVKILKK